MHFYGRTDKDDNVRNGQKQRHILARTSIAFTVLSKQLPHETIARLTAFGVSVQRNQNTKQTRYGMQCILSAFSAKPLSPKGSTPHNTSARNVFATGDGKDCNSSLQPVSGRGEMVKL